MNMEMLEFLMFFNNVFFLYKFYFYESYVMCGKKNVIYELGVVIKVLIFVLYIDKFFKLFLRFFCFFIFV